jgi:Na+-translocating ferredoxin:NAD+ oxidoreductase RnfC subunit
LKLKQQAGKPAAPVVGSGERVKRGQPVARVGEKDLGATIHSSIDGVVGAVFADSLEIHGS